MLRRLPEWKACFVAGTLVDTPDGPVAIETLSAGQWVLARFGADTAAPRPYQILEARRGVARVFVHVRTESGEVTATRGHPFHVVGRGWTEARHLAVGDLLTTIEGPPIAVAALRTEERAEDVATYNLHVDEVSSYFVRAGNSVLVHNDGVNFDQVLYWILGANARVRPTDVDGMSVWRTTSRAEVETLFKIRFNMQGQTGNHSAYTEAQLAAKGFEVARTPGEAPFEGPLEHFSIRPNGVEPYPHELTEAEVQTLAEALKPENNAPEVKGIKPKSLDPACK
jgi:hypothetical protein